MLQGDLPPRVRGLVTEWASLHQRELAHNWELAQSAQPLVPIEPLEWNPTMPREITQVEPLGDDRLALTFRGGERREVVISRIVPFQGVFAPLRDQAFFRQVAVNPDLGTIAWPNGADLCPDVLYAQSAALGSEHAA